jgi:hypothetical protein
VSEEEGVSAKTCQHARRRRRRRRKGVSECLKKKKVSVEESDRALLMKGK